MFTSSTCYCLRADVGEIQPTTFGRGSPDRIGEGALRTGTCTYADQDVLRSDKARIRDRADFLQVAVGLLCIPPRERFDSDSKPKPNSYWPWRVANLFHSHHMIASERRFPFVPITVCKAHEFVQSSHTLCSY